MLIASQVLVENGVLLSGIVCKKTLGASSGSLCHVVAQEKSPEVCREFYSNIQVNYTIIVRELVKFIEIPML